MATGYIVTGRGDLDGLFKPLASTAAAATGFKVGATDLAQLFEPRGAAPAITDTGFKVGAADLASIFMNIAAPGDLVTNHTLTAGVAAPRTGFAAGTAFTGLTAFGALSPRAVGGFFIDATYYSTTGPTCSITLQGNGVTPNDIDQNFKAVAYTGVFADSGGASVTRTVTRAGAASTSTNAGGGNFFRSWAFAGNAFQFINGNTYAVAFSRAP